VKGRTMATFALLPVSLVFPVFILFAFVSKSHTLQTGINYTARKLVEVLANKYATRFRKQFQQLILCARYQIVVTTYASKPENHLNNI
jgi:hypothetical protein